MTDLHQTPVIVIDDKWLFVTHAWSIIGRCRRIDPGHVARLGCWPESGRPSDDGLFRFYWRRPVGQEQGSDGAPADTLSGFFADTFSAAGVSAARAWVLLDLCNEHGRIQHVVPTIKALCALDGMTPDRFLAFSAYRTPRRALRELVENELPEERYTAWADRLSTISPKTPDALRALRHTMLEAAARHPTASTADPKPRGPIQPARSPATGSADVREAPLSGHVLVSGLAFDTRSGVMDGTDNLEGELGLPPLGTLYGEVSKMCFKGAPPEVGQPFGQWWDDQIESRLDARIGNGRDVERDAARLRARIHEAEHSAREAFCRCLRGYDWGVPSATFLAVHQSWPVWLCLSPMTFAERAVRTVAARVGENHSWQVIKPAGRRDKEAGESRTADEARISPERLARARAALIDRAKSADEAKDGDQSQRRVLFKLAGEISSPSTVALGLSDVGPSRQAERQQGYQRLRKALDAYEDSGLSVWDAAEILTSALGKGQRDRGELADFQGLSLTAEAYLERYRLELGERPMVWHIVDHPFHDDMLLKMVGRILERAPDSHVFVLVGAADRLLEPLTIHLSAHARRAGYARPGGWHVACATASPVGYLHALERNPPWVDDFYGWAESMKLKHAWGAGILPSFEHKLIKLMLAKSQRARFSRDLWYADDKLQADLARRNLLIEGRDRTGWSLTLVERQLRKLSREFGPALRRWLELFRKVMKDDSKHLETRKDGTSTTASDDNVQSVPSGWSWLLDGPTYGGGQQA